MDTSKQVTNGNATAAKPQHHSGSSGHVTAASGTTASVRGGGSQLGECPEGGASGTAGGLQRQASNSRSSKHATPSQSMVGLTLNLSNGTGGGSKSSKTCSSNGMDLSKIFIKKEPENFETGGHRQCNRSPTTSTASGRRLSLTGKDGKRTQRLSTSQKTSSDKMMRSFSISEDLEDDLKLSAADCMGGVISTPPIKPLEEGDDIITTPSPPTSAGLLGSSKSGSSVGSRNGSAAENISFTGTSTTSNMTTSTTNAGQVTSHVTGHMTSPSNTGQTELTKKPGGSVKDTNASLMQELNDFSKILDEVAMEQRANEERLVLNQPQTDVFRGAQSRDIVAPPHVARPTHLMSPPPYYAATTPKQVSQQFFNPAGQPSFAGTPHGASPVQDPSPFIRVDYRQSLAHQQHMTSAQVDPTTFAPRPDQLRSDHLQCHPHISAASPQLHQQPPALGQTRPVLVSPTVRRPLPHTPISSHIPPFPDPTVSSVTTPTMPPHTPTTPLEHFNTFPPPPSQIHSPTHPQFVATPNGSVPISSTAFSFSGQLRSPTVTSSGFNWQANSLRDKMLAQVNSQIEARIGGQKRLGQEAGFPIPPSTKMVAVGSSPFPHPQITGHNHMTPQQQAPPPGQQYLPTATPTGSGGAHIGYTGPSQPQPQLVHTISYQGPGASLTSAPSYPHHHL